MTRRLNPEQERLAVMAAERGWAAAARDQDLDRSLYYMADDATMLPPAGGPVVGKAAIRDFIATAFATPGFSVHWEPLVVVVADGGDLAYTQARSVYTSRAPDGTLQTLHAQGPDVSWRCVIDIWNEAPPPADHRVGDARLPQSQATRKSR